MGIFDKMCNNKLCSYQHSATKAQNHAYKNISSGDFDDDMEEIEFGMKETKSFKASTPNKTNSECEDCDDQAECVECIVKRVRRRHGAAIEKPRIIRKRVFSTFNEKEYMEQLEEIDWKDVINIENIDEAAEAFHNKLSSI